MTHNARYTLSQRSVRPAEFLGFLELRGVDLGLTVEQCLEPEAFSQKQSLIMRHTILRIHGTNGRCWATVTDISPLGNLVIEIDHVPSSSATPAAEPAKRRAA